MKKITRLALALALALTATHTPATAQNLIPVPLKTEQLAGQPLVWLNVGSIEAPAELQNEVEHVQRILSERAGMPQLTAGGSAKITLSIDTSLSHDEAYTLTLNADGVQIAGKTAAGVFYGIMTMEQLMIDNTASALCTQTAAIHIEDAPRTQVREMMIDPARIFVPYEDLKKVVPEMARYKFNSIHLHLVDDQAWRIEIKKYPKLIENGTYRVGMDDMQIPISGYYTQEEMKDFVQYCAKYHIMVVPEIEMPGHEVAAVHCYPEREAVAREEVIAEREMVVAKEAAVCRERRRMGRGEDKVARAVYHRAFLLRVAAPKQENEVFALRRQPCDDRVGEGLPALSLVGTRLVGADGERGVEEQNALLRPAAQTAALGRAAAGVGLYFLKDVLQRGRQLHSVFYREAQPLGLSRLVVGVLAYYHHFHAFERAKVESVEYLPPGRVARPGAVFPAHEVGETGEIGRGKLFFEPLAPRWVNLYVHSGVCVCHRVGRRGFTNFSSRKTCLRQGGRGAGNRSGRCAPRRARRGRYWQAGAKARRQCARR